jgi:hypothetical protein
MSDSDKDAIAASRVTVGKSERIHQGFGRLQDNPSTPEKAHECREIRVRRQVFAGLLLSRCGFLPWDWYWHQFIPLKTDFQPQSAFRYRATRAHEYSAERRKSSTIANA